MVKTALEKTLKSGYTYYGYIPKYMNLHKHLRKLTFKRSLKSYPATDLRTDKYLMQSSYGVTLPKDELNFLRKLRELKKAGNIKKLIELLEYRAIETGTLCQN